MKIGDFTIEESREEREVVFRVEAESLGEIARQDDRVIMSLEHLVERILALEDEELRARIDLGVSDPEEQRLEDEARAHGEEVVRTGQSITLDPMNSRERWIVHNALKDVDGVRSESVGDGPVKRVQISKA
jgi:spoIIIJ-associated protein